MAVLAVVVRGQRANGGGLVAQSLRLCNVRLNRGINEAVIAPPVPFAGSDSAGRLNFRRPKPH